MFGCWLGYRDLLISPALLRVEQIRTFPSVQVFCDSQYFGTATIGGRDGVGLQYGYPPCSGISNHGKGPRS